MKLPADTTSSPGEEQEITGSSGTSSASGSTTSEGGQSPSGGASSSSSSGSSESGSGSGPSSTSNNQNNPNPEVDFSEYLWMENEEEFDSQVLQELEDEEMINYYYELYEASLNENGTWGPNTANIRVTGPPPPFAPSSAPQEDDAVDNLAQGITSRLTFNSRLNPEAAEFVPRTTTNMSSPN